MVNKIYYDTENGASVCENHSAYLVHEGKLFHASKRATNIANSVTIEFMVVVPANKKVHIQYEARVGGACNVDVLRDVTVTANGTSITTYDYNRISDNSAETKLFVSPAGATGTLFAEDYIPGGASVLTRSGGIVRIGAEWVLKQNTKSLLRITNVSGGTITVAGLADFYENGV